MAALSSLFWYSVPPAMAVLLSPLTMTIYGPDRVRTCAISAKTCTRSSSSEQAKRYRSWFDNAARLREVASELETLTADRLQDDLDRFEP